MSTKTKIIIVISIIALAAMSRLVKHPFNFTPLAAMALFAGCYLHKKWGVLLPLAAVFISDYFIGFYNWRLMASVYASLVFIFAIGLVLNKYKTWYNIIFASLTSSVVFFAVTNFSVWSFSGWYPHTWAGFVSCFTLALPFFRNTLAGDLVYTTAFFGIYELAVLFSRELIIGRKQIKL